MYQNLAIKKTLNPSGILKLIFTCDASHFQTESVEGRFYNAFWGYKNDLFMFSYNISIPMLLHNFFFSSLFYFLWNRFVYLCGPHGLAHLYLHIFLCGIHTRYFFFFFSILSCSCSFQIKLIIVDLRIQVQEFKPRGYAKANKYDGILVAINLQHFEWLLRAKCSGLYFRLS